MIAEFNVSFGMWFRVSATLSKKIWKTNKC